MADLTFDEIRRRRAAAATIATERVMDAVLTQGQTKLAPLDEGTLRASAGRDTELVAGGEHHVGQLEPSAEFAAGLGTLAEVMRTGPPVTSCVVRAFFATVYAAAIHEGQATQTRDGKEVLWKVEHWSEPGTGTKYLEAPFKLAYPSHPDLCARAIDAALK